MIVWGRYILSPFLPWDLRFLLQYILSAFAVALGLHFLLKKFASNYFLLDDSAPPPNDSFNLSLHHHHHLPAICAFCGKHASKKCSRCKSLRYCSEACQQSHWRSEHKMKCKEFSSTATVNLARTGQANLGFEASSSALVPGSGRGTSRPVKQAKNVLFPYDEFVKFFDWGKPGFCPCGLLNCGNSCFANVVLQCLSFTKPLIAYLLEKGHRRECSHNDWCFLCEFEIHVEKTRLSSQAFSPMTILSRLPKIGGTLGYGRQEDAHEFMRFAIDAMQSVCLDEFGGEKAVPPNLQETTLIEHIFGGHLQSEVICTKCEKNSSQYENMMDLTVEIHGDAASLEECLDQFTMKEWLHGENMYKCDGCKDYVKAWKRLTVKRAPNILTIALKRFKSGRFGKLNKRVTFPETLDLSPYMSEAGDGSDIYKLFAVVVHIDMLNASYFGHYICYIKDFCGNWYRIDDWKVTSVELEEVLSQGAYMLLYSRVTARPSALQTIESLETAEEQTIKPEVEPARVEQAKCLSNMENVTSSRCYEVHPSDSCPELKVSSGECESSAGTNIGENGEDSKDKDVIDVAIEASSTAVESSYIPSSQAVEDLMDIDMSRSNSCSSVLEEMSGCNGGEGDIDMAEADLSSDSPNGFSCYNKDSSVSIDGQNMKDDSEHVDVIKCKPIMANGNGHYGNGYADTKKYSIPVEDGVEFPGVGSFSTEASSAEMHQLKRRSPFYTYESDKGNGVIKVEMSGDKLII